MALKLTPQQDGKVLEVQVLGKLTHAEYQECVAEFERLLKEHGKLRVLYDLVNFHGWDAAALWDEVKFDVKHFSDVERLASVGDATWKKWMMEFYKPFTAATVRYFERDQIEEARAWLNEP
jgi:hypothetical protein